MHVRSEDVADHSLNGSSFEMHYPFDRWDCISGVAAETECRVLCALHVLLNGYGL